MFTNSIIAATGALLTMVAAVPMADQHHHHHPAHKRDYVWVTHTEVAVETIPVTKTVWIEPGETPPTKHKKPNKYGSSSSSSSPAPAAYTPSAPASPSTSSSSPAPAAYTPPAPASPSTSSSSSTPVPNAYSPPAVPTTSTSVYVAPATTTPTSTYVAPTTYAAPSSSSAAPVSYGSSGSSGSGLSSGIAASGKSFSGDLTWYDVGLGACGWTNVASDHIVAISEAIFDSYNTGNPNNNPLCGKYLTITGKDGSPYQAKIVDRCPGCKEDDLDLSQDFFNLVTNNGDGRVGNMKWSMD